jgi:RHS repeat-associated protein
MKRVTAVAVFVCSFAWQNGYSQDLPDVQQGLQPYTAFHGGQLDVVNLTNGGLTVRIPLVSYPQKGSLSLSYSIIFNSFGFEDIAVCDSPPNPDGPIDEIPLHNNCSNTVQPIPTGVPGHFPLGPRLIADQTLTSGGVSAPEQLQTLQPPINGQFYVISADNSEHPVSPVSDGSYRSIDGSGYKFVPASAPNWGNGNLGVTENAYPGDTAMVMSAAAGAITDSRGNVYSGSNLSGLNITDPFGNTMSIAGNSGLYSGLPATDSTGRGIPAPTSGNSSACPTISQAQYQPLSGALLWQPPGSGSGFLLCYANVSVHSSLLVGGTGEYSKTVSMLQSIVLPNGTHWGFVYDSYVGSGYTTGTGNLIRLIYPTGGSVVYNYGGGAGESCDSNRASGLDTGAILTFPKSIYTRTMEDAQGNLLGTWTYSYPDGATSTGSIVSPAGDLTVTKLVGDGSSGSGCGLLDAGQDVYQGNPSIPSSVTPLQSTTVAYTFPTMIQPPYVSLARESQTSTTLNGSVTSTVSKSYPSVLFGIIGCNYQGINCATGASYSIPFGSPNGTITTDYSGTTLKKDQITYQWQASSAYWTANLVDIPSSDQVLNASGATQASTTYTYDQSGYTQYPGVAKGLLTTVSEWNNDGNAIVTHTGWNQYGMKSSSVDGNGSTSTFSYSTNGITTNAGQSTTVSCEGSHVTSTTNPLGQIVSGTYDCDTGFLTSFKDANSNTTSLVPDSMRRIKSVTYPAITAAGATSPANPVTTFTYTDSSNTVKRDVAGSPDPDQVTTVVFDAFGRETSRTTSSEAGNIEADKSYDTDGRLWKVTNPYIQGQQSSGLTVYSYDAVNRKTEQLQPDGTSTLQWFYSGNVLDSYDELQHHRQDTSDALGHLTKVMEPDPSSGSLALETDYIYNSLGDLTNVNQKGKSGDTLRTRGFTYDSLSRLINSSNPETGSILYVYDQNSNLITKTSPSPNLSSGTQAISYCYDALNRVTAKFYSATMDCSGYANAVERYAYDSSAISGASNTVGRLTSAIVLNGSTTVTQRQPYSYDADGHLNAEQQCPYGTCASPYKFQYQYDLAGNLLVSNNGLPSSNANALTFDSEFDGAAHLTSLNGAATSSSPAWPGNGNLELANSSSNYGPFGLLSAKFGTTSGSPAVSLVRTYDNRGRITSEQDTGTVTTSSATPSTGTVTISGSEAAPYTVPAKSGTTTVSVTGSDGSNVVCQTICNQYTCYQTCNSVPDTGQLSVIIDGFTSMANYGGSSTDASLAQSLSQGFIGSSCPVTSAWGGSNSFTITAKATGTASNYPFTVSNGDFTLSDPSQALTGGANAGSVYDAGTATATVTNNYVSPAVSYSTSITWGQNDTASTIASRLASGLNTAASLIVSASSSGGLITLTSKTTGPNTAYSVSVSIADGETSYFSHPSFSAASNNLSGGRNAGSGPGVIYSYQISSSGGYAANGDLLSYTDSVMGAWTFGYDYLDRLTTGTPSTGSYQGQHGCWSYDSFGNRTIGVVGTAACGTTATASYNAANKVTWVQNTAPAGFTYSAAGNVTADNLSQYLYDAENRICATRNPINNSITGYVYEAGGERVAKGNMSSFTACPAASSFSALTNQYLLGPGGELVTELNGSGAWQHSNIFPAGHLAATYDSNGWHYHLTDWLGTRRVQASASGTIDESCRSLPYGDSLSCSGSGADATEHHFTGKERDSESGNDYFSARYYASSMGRFMSPDWASDPTAVPYASYANPQSLNLYNYMRNNPLGGTDPDGHCCEADFDSFQTPEQKQRGWSGGSTDFDKQFMQTMKGVLELGAAALAGPEVLAGAGSATTVLQGLGVGVAALGTTGTAVNGVTDIVGGATHTDVDAATNAVTAVTNPVAATVSIATGSMEKGSQAADLATVVKAGAGLAQGKAPNPAEVGSSLGGAKAAVTSMVNTVKSSVSGALAPSPSAPRPPSVPRPPACGSTPGAC